MIEIWSKIQNWKIEDLQRDGKCEKKQGKKERKSIINSKWINVEKSEVKN